MSQENLLEVKHLRTEFFSSKKSSVTYETDNLSFFYIKTHIIDSGDAALFAGKKFRAKMFDFQ